MPTTFNFTPTSDGTTTGINIQYDPTQFTYVSGDVQTNPAGTYVPTTGDTVIADGTVLNYIGGGIIYIGNLSRANWTILNAAKLSLATDLYYLFIWSTTTTDGSGNILTGGYYQNLNFGNGTVLTGLCTDQLVGADYAELSIDGGVNYPQKYLSGFFGGDSIAAGNLLLASAGTISDVTGNVTLPDATVVLREDSSSNVVYFGPNNATTGRYYAADPASIYHTGMAHWGIDAAEYDGNYYGPSSQAGVTTTTTYGTGNTTHGTLDMSLYALISTIVDAQYVATGHSNYTGGTAGSYPTTAATQAAQIATDAAAVDSALGGPLDTAATNPTVTLGASIITVRTADWEAARNTPVLTAAQIFNVANGGVASFTQRGVAISPTGTGGGGGGTVIIGGGSFHMGL